MHGSLKEVLNFSLGHRIAKNSCAVGHFDEGGSTKLVVGTAANKLILQNSGGCAARKPHSLYPGCVNELACR